MKVVSVQDIADNVHWLIYSADLVADQVDKMDKFDFIKGFTAEPKIMPFC